MRLSTDPDRNEAQAIAVLHAALDAGVTLLRAAEEAGLPVRCIWLSTSLEDAQVNAVGRMLDKYGRLLGPDDLRLAAKTDASVFGPAVQFRYQRQLEPPQASEGFSRIDVVPFERRHDPSSTERALLIWCDGGLMRSRSGGRVSVSVDDIDILPERSDVLRRHARDGWTLLGLAWRPEIADGTVTAPQVDAVFARMQELLGVTMDIQYCPHGGGPPACWCRKPLPGLGVEFIAAASIRRTVCMSAAGPRIPASRGGSLSSTATPTTFSPHAPDRY